MKGQSDPEHKKYLWVVIRTQKDRKQQTLIEVCTDFASLSTSTNIHRPAEQVFAIEEDSDSEDMFARYGGSTSVDWPEWLRFHSAAFVTTYVLSGRKMGYEMWPIARRMDNTRQSPGSPRTPVIPGQGYRPPFRSGRDFSRIKCFSCGQFGLVAQSQTRLFRTNRPVGICSLIVNSTRTSLHCRELYLDWDLTHTGLNALHQGSISSSPLDQTFRDSTQNSDIIDTIHKLDSDARNSVLFLDQSVIGPTGVSITQTADDLTVTDRSVSGEDNLPVAVARTGLLMDRPDPVDTEHMDDPTDFRTQDHR